MPGREGGRKRTARPAHPALAAPQNFPRGPTDPIDKPVRYPACRVSVGPPSSRICRHRQAGAMSGMARIPAAISDSMLHLAA